MEPARSHPRRREPSIHREHLGGYEFARIDLVDLGIPIEVASGPLGMALREATARPDLQIATRCLARRDARRGGGREVDVMEIVAMERRYRIGMRDEIAFPGKAAHHSSHNRASRSIVARAGGGRIGA